MSTPVAVTCGLAISTPTAARPDPAPTSSTRPAPARRKRSVGSGIGLLSITLRTTTAAAAHNAISVARMNTQRGQDRHAASAARLPATIRGAIIAYRTDQL
jgi:hypothetical protein